MANRYSDTLSEEQKQLIRSLHSTQKVSYMAGITGLNERQIRFFMWKNGLRTVNQINKGAVPKSVNLSEGLFNVNEYSCWLIGQTG